MKPLIAVLIALMLFSVVGCSKESKKIELSKNVSSMDRYFTFGTNNPWWNFQDAAALRITLRDNPEYLNVLRRHLKGFKNDDELIEMGIEALKHESIARWNQYAKEIGTVAAPTNTPEPPTKEVWQDFGTGAALVKVPQ